MLIFKLETAKGIFDQTHHLSHVAAMGVGWTVLTDSPRGAWHTPCESYSDARELFHKLTSPILAKESEV